MTSRQLVTGHWSLVTRKGQSTLEYVLVLAAILAAVILGATQLIGPSVQQALTDSSTTMEAATAKVQGGLGL